MQFKTLKSDMCMTILIPNSKQNLNASEEEEERGGNTAQTFPGFSKKNSCIIRLCYQQPEPNEELTENGLLINDTFAYSPAEERNLV